MSKRLSISQRLAKAGSLDVKREILHEWADNLDQDIDGELATVMRYACRPGADPEIGNAAIRLQTIRHKFIPALHRIIDKIEEMQ